MNDYLTQRRRFLQQYIDSKKLRNLKVGDIIGKGTKLYFSFPDELIEYPTTVSDISTYATPNPGVVSTWICDTLVACRNSADPLNDPTEVLLKEYPNLNTTKIVGGNTNYSTSIYAYNEYYDKIQINLKEYTYTHETSFEISFFNNPDYWNQFIKVDPTTLKKSL